MVDVNKLKSIIVLREKTQAEVAKYIGISSKTFYLKMKKGVFGSDEIEKMVEYLDIEEPIPIFLPNR